MAMCPWNLLIPLITGVCKNLVMSNNTTSFEINFKKNSCYYPMIKKNNKDIRLTHLVKNIHVILLNLVCGTKSPNSYNTLNQAREWGRKHIKLTTRRPGTDEVCGSILGGRAHLVLTFTRMLSNRSWNLLLEVYLIL